MSLNQSIPIFNIKHPCTAQGNTFFLCKSFLQNFSSKLAKGLNFHFIWFLHTPTIPLIFRVQSRWNRPILTILNLRSKSARFCGLPFILTMSCFRAKREAYEGSILSVFWSYITVFFNIILYLRDSNFFSLSKGICCQICSLNTCFYKINFFDRTNCLALGPVPLHNFWAAVVA